MIHCRRFPAPPLPRRRDGRDLDACLRDAEAYVDGRPPRPDRREPRRHAVPQARRHRPGDRRLPGGRRRPHGRGASGVPLGINVLANARHPRPRRRRAPPAPRFIRVNQWANAYVANEGFIEGQAAEALRYRAALRRRQRQGLRRHPRQARRPRDHRRPLDRRADPRPRLLRRRRRDRHRPAHRRRRDDRGDRRDRAPRPTCRSSSAPA